jgi:hypothetical protein
LAKACVELGDADHGGQLQEGILDGDVAGDAGEGGLVDQAQIELHVGRLGALGHGEIVLAPLEIAGRFDIDERQGVDPDPGAETVEARYAALLEGDGARAGARDGALAALDLEAGSRSPLPADAEDGMGIAHRGGGQGQGLDPRCFHDSSG